MDYLAYLDDDEAEEKKSLFKDDVSKVWHYARQHHGKPRLNRGRLNGKALRINDMLPVCVPDKCNFHLDDTPCNFINRGRKNDKTCALIYMMYSPIAMDWYRRYYDLKSQADLDSIGLFLVPKLIEFLRIQRGIMMTSLDHDRSQALEKGILDLIARMDKKLIEEGPKPRAKTKAKTKRLSIR